MQRKAGEVIPGSPYGCLADPGAGMKTEGSDFISDSKCWLSGDSFLSAMVFLGSMCKMDNNDPIDKPVIEDIFQI